MRINHSDVFKRLLTTITVFLFFDTSSLLAADPSQSAIRLLCRTKDGDTYGTAIYVCLVPESKERYLVTAYHNVYHNEETELSFHEENEVKEPLFGIVSKNFICLPTADLVIFQCTEAGIKTLEKQNRVAVELSVADAATTSRVIVYGNGERTIVGAVSKPPAKRPAARPLNYSAHGGVNEYKEAGDRLGPVIVTDETAKQTRLLFLESLRVTYGFSGGPVFTDDPTKGPARFALVGMLQGGDPREKTSAWAIPSSLIRTALANLKPKPFPPANGTWPTPLFGARAFGFADAVIALKLVLDDGFASPFLGGKNRSMDTTVALYKTGQLDINTTSKCKDVAGFTGAIAVLACDENAKLVWRTKARHEIELVAKAADRAENWTEFMPSELVSKVKRLFVFHWVVPRLDEKLKGDERALDSVRAMGEILKASTDEAKFREQFVINTDTNIRRISYEEVMFQNNNKFRDFVNERSKPSDEAIDDLAEDNEFSVSMLASMKAKFKKDDKGRVESIVLSGDKIDDRLVPQLKLLPKLRQVTLHNTLVSNAGLAYLIECNRLEVVRIAYCRVTDNGLPHLGKIKGLKRLEIWGAGLSEKKVDELKALFAAQKRTIEVDFRRGAILGVNGLPNIQPEGVEITFVNAGSVAASAGLRKGDIVTHYGKNPIADFEALKELIAKDAVGDSATLAVIRGKEKIDLSIKYTIPTH